MSRSIVNTCIGLAKPAACWTKGLTPARRTGCCSATRAAGRRSSQTRPGMWCVFATEVAGLTGRHRFVARKDALYRLAQRHLPAAALPPPTRRARLEAVTDVVERAIGPALMVGITSAKSGEQAAAAVPKAVDLAKHLPARTACTAAAVHAELASRAAMAVGTHREAADVAAYGERRGRPVDDTQEKGRQLYQTPEGRTYALFGRCDATTDGVVEEFKSRRRRLFHQVPEYERVQLWCYMALLGLERGRLIESHRDEQAVHEIEMDPEKWAQITYDLGVAVDEAHALRC